MSTFEDDFVKFDINAIRREHPELMRNDMEILHEAQECSVCHQTIPAGKRVMFEDKVIKYKEDIVEIINGQPVKGTKSTGKRFYKHWPPCVANSPQNQQ